MVMTMKDRFLIHYYLFAQQENLLKLEKNAVERISKRKTVSLSKSELIIPHFTFMASKKSAD
jgi:hypothetical protein